MRQAGIIVWALMRRALNEILRVPGASIPGVLAPAIFLIGLSGVFGAASGLHGFSAANFRTFIIPVSLLQGAGFTGAATGVNLARDIEQGWFDRLLLAPAPRPVILLGIVTSASLRALMPVTFLLAIGFATGVHWPGVLGLVLAIVLVCTLAAAGALYASTIAIRFATQQAAPLMQIGTFIAVLFTTAYAPKPLLASWLREIANINPVTRVLEGVRQGFVGGVTWTHTWEALVAVAGLLLVFGALALRSMRRFSQ
jgi:ABC-2 type transport system permease protein